MAIDNRIGLLQAGLSPKNGKACRICHASGGMSRTARSARNYDLLLLDATISA